MNERERAAAGAAWLDEHARWDWRIQVRPDRIDISRSFWCVLGQVYGSYSWAPHAAHFDGSEFLAPARGFVTYRDDDADELVKLNEAWRELVTR